MAGCKRHDSSQSEIMDLKGLDGGEVTFSTSQTHNKNLEKCVYYEIETLRQGYGEDTNRPFPLEYFTGFFQAPTYLSLIFTKK